MVLQFIQGGIFFCLGPIFRKFWGFLLVFSTCFALFSVFLLFPLSITIFVFVHGFWCNFIYSNIDQVFSINPSGNVFVFGDFILHHKDWFTCSGGTDRPGKLCCDYVAISNDLTEMVNFPTRIACCDSQSYSFRFISSDPGICSTKPFPLGKFWSCCWISFHWHSSNPKGIPFSSNSLWLSSWCLG